MIGAESLHAALIGLVLLLLNAILLNFILVRHELLPKNSLIGALVFITLMSHSVTGLGLNPVLCATLFIIPAFDQMLKTYGKSDPSRQVFSAAMLLSVASLFYFPSAVLLILLVFSFIIFGTFSFRVLLVAIVGVMAVYVYLFVYYFIMDNVEGQYCLYIEWFQVIPAFNMPAPGVQYMIWVVIIFVFATSLLYSLSHLNEWNISVRKKVLLNLWFIGLAAGTLVYTWDNFSMALLILAVPFTIVISAYFANRKKISFIMEVLYLLLLLLIIMNNTLLATC